MNHVCFRSNELKVLSMSCRVGKSPQPFIPQPFITVATWLFSGLIGSGLVAQAAWARPVLNDTSHFLVAQQVVDGLPPPPPTAFGQESIAQNQAVQQYLVVVNSDSEMMLSQVQQVQPTASLQEYNGQRFIQAGVFNDPTTAQQQVSTLAASGITAQVVTLTNTASTISQAPATGTTYGSSYDVNSNTLPPPEALPTTSFPATEVEFGSSDPNALPPASPEARGSRAYYVIIPGSGQKAQSITSQISRLTSGMGIDNMVQAGTNNGSHVRVGPFNDRSAASRWSRYFRDFGMDARVSYGR